MIRVVKITRMNPAGEVVGSYVMQESEADVVRDEVLDADVGAQWKIELMEMSREDYDAMPEFDGY